MSKQFHYFLLLFVIQFFFINHLFSQEKKDTLYGLNPFLYNGEIYSSIGTVNMSGNQYLISDEFVNGNLIINDQLYEDCLINYDIYKQHVLLKFKLNYRTIIIKLSYEKLESFYFGDKYFEIIPNENSEKTVYQTYGSGQYKILYQWYKLLSLSHVAGTTNYVFSNPKKRMYLQIGNEKFRYKNKRTFISLFNNNNKKPIKKFISKNKIKIKKATDAEVNLLINYCNTLIM